MDNKKTWQNQSKTRILAECAIMVGLATVLSMFTLFPMPQGGSVTPLSMLPVMLIALRHGTKIGLGTAFVYACGQLFLGLSSLVSWGLTATVFVASLFLDYLLAFTVLGFAGVFKKHGIIGALSGIILGCALRFACHFISGAVLFGSFSGGVHPLIYSLTYNGSYMGVEAVLSVAGAAALLTAPPIRKLIWR